jgi:hypothetical protein
MNKLLLVAAVPVVLLSACAPAARTTADASGAAGTTLYCWKDRVATSGDTLVCNWDSNVADACKSTYSSAIRKESVASGPQDAGRRCSNGQWLVQVTTK